MNEKNSQIGLFDIPGMLLSAAKSRELTLAQKSEIYFHDYSLSHLMFFVSIELYSCTRFPSEFANWIWKKGKLYSMDARKCNNSARTAGNGLSTNGCYCRCCKCHVGRCNGWRNDPWVSFQRCFIHKWNALEHQNPDCIFHFIKALHNIGHLCLFTPCFLWFALPILWKVILPVLSV